MSEWKAMSLKDTLELIIDNRGRNPKSYADAGIPVIDNYLITSEGVPNLNNIKRFIDEETYNSFIRKHIKRNDVLITLVGNGYGKVAITPSQKCVIIQNTIGLRCNNKNDNIYLYYLLKDSREILMNLNRGAAQPSIKVGDIQNLEFKFPSLENQQRIASILKSLDDRIENNRKINETLEAMAQAVFKSWFVDFEPTKAKIAVLQTGGNEEEATLAAMQAISGKSPTELELLRTQTPKSYAELKSTAQLFPSALQDSELGGIPLGWEVGSIGDIVERLKPPKRYTKKQVELYGNIPVYEQGADILLGHHNDEAGFIASTREPLFIFGDHTCVTYLSCNPFDISQNVIPLKGKAFPTMWVYYAIQGKQTFQEYRRHWSEFIIKDTVIPSGALAKCFTNIVTKFYETKEDNIEQSQTLTQTRDTLLPKLLSGEIDVSTLNKMEIKNG